MGHGTSFEILLPKVDLSEEVGPIQGQPVPRGNGEHLLFIDDEPMVLSSGRKVLMSLGYEVTSMNDGIEALDTFKRKPEKFDLIITDNSMPKISGFDLAKKLLIIHPEVPIILCTGYSEIVTPEKAKEAGIREMLLKPFSRREVGEMLHRILNPSWAGLNISRER